MTVFIALLPAVNVGGTGKVSMSDLRAACEQAGLRRVSSYIASGNLVFETDQSAADVNRLIADLLRDRFGLARNRPLLRTPDVLTQVIARNPFADAADVRPNSLMVAFLDGTPDPAAGDVLAGYAGPERLHLDGSHLYIDYPQGVGRSKLTPAFLGKALSVPMTARNWNTIRKLREMASF
jgi:uncharacterized protein (DUF1697 family)